jgi:integrase
MPRSDSIPRNDLIPALTVQILTYGGTLINTRAQVWEWTEGVHRRHLDFRPSHLKVFETCLKLALVPFVVGRSGAHVQNVFQAFSDMTLLDHKRYGPVVTAQRVSNWAAALGESGRWRLGTVNGLLQKWVALRLPGVEPSCADYLRRRRTPGNVKGRAVETRDPVDGPFSEEEFVSLNASVNAAYGRAQLPMWVLILFRLLTACGGRISQYASLKIGDFNEQTRVLQLPKAKTGEAHQRLSFIECDIAPQTSQLLSEYIRTLRDGRFDNDDPLLPQTLIKSLSPDLDDRKLGDLFHGHCLAIKLSLAFSSQMAEISPATERLDFSPIPITPRRFRYTFGTRLVEEGASKAVVADRLGHSDLQNVGVYFAASPRIIERINAAIGTMLAPVAQAFLGKLVRGSEQSTLNGQPGSVIMDFRVSSKSLGACEGGCKSCGFLKPDGCYTCFRFEPWADAPHESVLERLTLERAQVSDPRIAQVKDLTIKAVKEVIALCDEFFEDNPCEVRKVA